MSGDSKEAIERRTDEAFARAAWQDPRASYRELLRGLKESDPAAFQRAVDDYESIVVARLADPDTDPVDAWFEFGTRLVASVGRGRTTVIDAAGAAAELTRARPGPDPALVLHMPADESAPAIVVAEPREPSAAQLAAKALLAERRQALPA